MLSGEEFTTNHHLSSNNIHVSVSVASDEKKPIRILIAAHHAIYRDGLRALLQRESGFQVVGDAPDGEAAVLLAAEMRPDVMLLDMLISKRNGIDVLQQLRRVDLPVRVLALTADIGRNDALQALNFGARGVILNSSPSATLFEAIRKVKAGEYWISPESVATLVERLKSPPRRTNIQNAKFGLTPRELEVIIAVVSGYSNPEIAEKLSLSEQTVKHHLTHVFDKLGVYNRVELALFAVNHRLVENGA